MSVKLPYLEDIICTNIRMYNRNSNQLQFLKMLIWWLTSYGCLYHTSTNSQHISTDRTMIIYRINIALFAEGKLHKFAGSVLSAGNLIESLNFFLFSFLKVIRNTFCEFNFSWIFQFLEPSKLQIYGSLANYKGLLHGVLPLIGTVSSHSWRWRLVAPIGW